MNLKNGIRILNRTSIPLQELLSYNDGIETGLGIVHSEDFENGAYIPNNNWCIPSNKQTKLLTSYDSKHISSSNTIYLGILPENIIKNFKELGIKYFKTREELDSTLFKKLRLSKKLNDNLNIFTEKFCSGDNIFHVISISKPNQGSTTIRKINGKYIGLHLDTSDKNTTIYNCYNAYNRICINVGKEPRYLLFVNLSVKQLVNALVKNKKVKIDKLSNKNIASYFFKNFPDYPIIKIKINPYHFYIAPTDNCIHDGSTQGSKALDFTFHYLGNFKNLK